MGGGELLMSESMFVESLEFEPLLLGCEGVNAYLAEHGTGATSITLPAAGGTVRVDVVICNDQPLDGWEARLAANAPAVVSLDSATWTANADLLWWAGLSAPEPASHYSPSVMHWSVIDARGAILTHSWIAGAHGIERLMEPGVQGSIGWPLDAIAGPISLPSLVQGLYVTDGSIGGVTGRPLAPGTTVVATLTLQVTGSPGVYTVGLADATCILTAQPDAAVPLADTPVFTVQIAP